MEKPDRRNYLQEQPKSHHKICRHGERRKNQVSEKLLAWADLIFVMEKKHKLRLRDRFGATMDEKKIVTLYIPDDYQYMDPELIEILESSVAPHLD